jgi:nucleoside-diphosphate-sugar epimerase
VLLTGGTGFIGRHLPPLLIDAGFDVHATTRDARPRTAGIEWHTCDLLVREAVSAVVRAVRPTHLLHMAWAPMPGIWESAANEAWWHTGAHLADEFAAASGERIVVTGTCAEYDWSDGICDEASTTVAPASRYGSCKDALRRHIEALGCSWSWARPFHTFGPAEDPSRFVPSIARDLLAGRPAAMTSGRQVRDMMDVRDVASALTALVASPVQGAVNVGSGEPAPLLLIAQEIAQLVGVPADLVRAGALPDRPGDPAVLVPVLDRLHDEVGWTSARPRVERLRETVEWWRDAAGAVAP